MPNTTREFHAVTTPIVLTRFLPSFLPHASPPPSPGADFSTPPTPHPTSFHPLFPLHTPTRAKPYIYKACCIGTKKVSLFTSAFFPPLLFSCYFFHYLSQILSFTPFRPPPLSSQLRYSPLQLPPPSLPQLKLPRCPLSPFPILICSSPHTPPPTQTCECHDPLVYSSFYPLTRQGTQKLSWSLPPPPTLPEYSDPTQLPSTPLLLQLPSTPLAPNLSVLCVPLPPPVLHPTAPPSRKAKS